MEREQYALMARRETRHWWYVGMRQVALAVLERALAGRRGLRLLDAGCGTGGTTVELGRFGQVVGIDLVWEALLPARARGLPRLTRGSVEQLPFADATFDAVTNAFLLRNLADPAAGLAEQVRVLRAGGRLVVLETTPGPRGVLGVAFRLYFRRLVPLIGGVVAGDRRAYSYLPASTLAFVAPERQADLLRAQGLSNVSVTRLALGTVALSVGD